MLPLMKEKNDTGIEISGYLEVAAFLSWNPTIVGTTEAALISEASVGLIALNTAISFYVLETSTSYLDNVGRKTGSTFFNKLCNALYVS